MFTAKVAKDAKGVSEIPDPLISFQYVHFVAGSRCGSPAGYKMIGQAVVYESMPHKRG